MQSIMSAARVAAGIVASVILLVVLLGAIVPAGLTAAVVVFALNGYTGEAALVFFAACLAWFAWCAAVRGLAWLAQRL